MKKKLKVLSGPCALVDKADVELMVKTGAMRPVKSSERVMQFVASTERVDEQGDIVRQSWDLDDFSRNPVVLWNHDQGMPIGRAVKEHVLDEGTYGTSTVGKHLCIWVEWMDKSHGEHVEPLFNAYNDGFLKGGSVGFVPKNMDPVNDPDRRRELGMGDMGVEYKENKLSEWTLCSVPANPDALSVRGFTDTVTKTLWKRGELDPVAKALEDVLTDVLDFAPELHGLVEQAEDGDPDALLDLAMKLEGDLLGDGGVEDSYVQSLIDALKLAAGNANMKSAETKSLGFEEKVDEAKKEKRIQRFGEGPGIVTIPSDRIDWDEFQEFYQSNAEMYASYEGSVEEGSSIIVTFDDISDANLFAAQIGANAEVTPKSLGFKPTTKAAGNWTGSDAEGWDYNLDGDVAGNVMEVDGEWMWTWGEYGTGVDHEGFAATVDDAKRQVEQGIANDPMGKAGKPTTKSIEKVSSQNLLNEIIVAMDDADEAGDTEKFEHLGMAQVFVEDEQYGDAELELRLAGRDDLADMAINLDDQQLSLEPTTKSIDDTNAKLVEAFPEDERLLDLLAEVDGESDTEALVNVIDHLRAIGAPDDLIMEVEQYAQVDKNPGGTNSIDVCCSNCGAVVKADLDSDAEEITSYADDLAGLLESATSSITEAQEMAGEGDVSAKLGDAVNDLRSALKMILPEGAAEPTGEIQDEVVTPAKRLSPWTHLFEKIAGNIQKAAGTFNSRDV